MRHYFKAIRAEEKGKWDLIWFSSDNYTKETAAAKFIPLGDNIDKEAAEVKFVSIDEYNEDEDNGCIYDSIKYSKVMYLGEHESDWKMMTEEELLDAIFDQSGKYEYDTVAGTIKVQK